MSKIKNKRKVFVGREKELSDFRDLLAYPESETWILNVYGDGGIGKTWLLEQFRQIALHEYADILVPSQFVDFYFTANRLEFGVLRNLAAHLEGGDFTTFEKALTQYDERMTGFIPVSPEDISRLSVR